MGVQGRMHVLEQLSLNAMLDKTENLLDNCNRGRG